MIKLLVSGFVLLAALRLLTWALLRRGAAGEPCTVPFGWSMRTHREHCMGGTVRLVRLFYCRDTGAWPGELWTFTLVLPWLGFSRMFGRK